MALSVESFELFGSFVELDLSSLCLSNFLLKLSSLASNFDGELLDLEGELLDLGLISSSVLFER